jgi:AraC-like DNA-binding protein
MALLHNLKNVFHVLILFQCLFFSAYLLSAKPRRRGSTLLALFLIAVGLSELGGVFLHFLDLRTFIIARLPQILYLSLPLTLLAAPLLYLFVSAVVRSDRRLRSSDAFHLVPCGLYALLIASRYHVHSTETMRQVVAAGGPLSRPEALVFELVLYVQWLAYGLACFVRLRKHRSSLKDHFSTLQPWDLAWLNTLLSAVILTRSLEAIEYGLWYVTEDATVIVLYYAAQVLFLTFLTLLFLKTLNISPSLQGVVETLASRVKYERTLLSEAQRAEYAAKLDRLMESERPHLDPQLSLGDLAERALVPAHALSQVLNTHFGMNFFDYVNAYRIRESQKLLADPNNGARTILDVLLESGFNSKSVFNAAFKKHTGMTPSAYKKSLASASRRAA